jgi:intraflagellar transport protein 74
MNRIKQENAEIKQIEKDLTECRKMIDSYGRNIKEIESDMGAKKDDGDTQKYEILYQKEKQINDFMVEFEEEKQGYEKEISIKTKIIAALLEYMSKKIKQSDKLPSQADVHDMKKDLKFKERQLNDAEQTAAKLQVEVDTRTSDLQKIKNLESRIENELSQVTEGINKMEDDIANKYTRSDQVTEDFENEKERLIVIKKMVVKYKTGLSKQVTYHSMKHDTKKNQLM